MEKRKHSRVAFNAEATVRTTAGIITGRIENLSMKGMLLDIDRSLVGNDLIDITIRLSGSEFSINLKGEPVRQTDRGIAIEFVEMDLDSFSHLKRVVQHNSLDSDIIDEELCRFLSSE